jgi:hypothetical protein
MGVAVLVVALCALADAPRPLPLLHRPHAGEPLQGESGDIADLAQKKPDAVWYPLDLLRGKRIRAHVNIKGHDFALILDTGSYATMLTVDAAKEIGLLGHGDHVGLSHGIDVNGARMTSRITDLGDFDFGKVRVTGVPAEILEAKKFESSDGVIGFDVIANVDLLFAVDQGLLGVFRPSEGTLTARDNVLKLEIHHRGPHVAVHFDDGMEFAPFTLDTGAPTSCIQESLGKEYRLVLDKRFARPMGGWTRKRIKSSGATVIPHLRLGDERVDVGSVMMEHVGLANLIGLDVLLRQRTLMSPDRHELHLAPMPVRPPQRSAGPDGKPCDGGACVLASVEEQDGAPCAQLLVGPAWGGKHVTALVEVVDDDGNTRLGGGYFVFHADVPDGGGAACLDPEHVLPAYDIQKGARVSLLRFHVAPKEDFECSETIVPPDLRPYLPRLPEQETPPGALCMDFTGTPPTQPGE